MLSILKPCDLPTPTAAARKIYSGPNQKGSLFTYKRGRQHSASLKEKECYLSPRTFIKCLTVCSALKA